MHCQNYIDLLTSYRPIIETHFVFSGVSRPVSAPSIPNITPTPTLNIRPSSTGLVTDDFCLAQEALHPLIKEELKQSIQKRRKQAGLDELNVNMESKNVDEEVFQYFILKIMPHKPFN